MRVRDLEQFLTTAKLFDILLGNHEDDPDFVSLNEKLEVRINNISYDNEPNEDTEAQEKQQDLDEIANCNDEEDKYHNMEQERGYNQ